MEKLIVYNQPASVFAEAYRTICINVLATLDEKKLFEVVGVSDNCNADLIVANLALSIAQAGKKVLLMDCNLRHPKQHEIFGLQNFGITDVLSNIQNFTDFVQQTMQNNLDLLAAGSNSGNPVETLLSLPMQNLLNLVRDFYDVILLDLPAVDSVTDAVALGTKTDGALLVVTNKEDKVEQILKAKELFLKAGISILGCVLDKA